jgi:hypothetical protein
MNDNHPSPSGGSLRRWLESLGESQESINRDIAICRQHPETRALLVKWARADRAQIGNARKEDTQ